MAKIKVLIFLVFVCEFTLLSPFKTTVSAHELTAYLNSNTQTKAFALTQNNNISTKPQPMTPSEIQEMQKRQEEEKRKAEEAARIAAEQAEAQRVILASSSKAQAIDNFLSSKRSPLTGYGSKLVDIENRYGVPAKLIVAISGVESSFCQVNFRPYNCWGWMTRNNFGSYSDALEQYANYISSFYFAKGMTSPAAMARVYCPPTADSWSSKVYNFMGQMNF